MLKTMNTMSNKNDNGFTLIELLIVIAIIGILTSIAVPAFLGQREKAKVRTVEASAKGAVSELQGYLDSYVAGDPYLIVNNESGTQICKQANTASTSGRTCQNMYNQSSSGTYRAYPNGIGTMLNDFVTHHIYSGDKSPYTGKVLFSHASTATSEGKIIVTEIGSREIQIAAFADDMSNAIFSQLITAR